MKKYCFFNGKIVEEKNAHINLYDLGVLRGYGVFDFMCSANGKPFLLTDHWNRLKQSAASLGLKIPIARQKYEEAIQKLIKKNAYKNPAIRTVLTAGTSADGITISGEPTFYILIHDMDTLLPAPQLYKNGAKIITHEFARDNCTSKTTNYIEAIKNQKKKNARGAIEILYIKNNSVLECTTSNIFIIKNNTLITPHDGMLFGITRKCVVKIAQKAKIKVKEQKITKKQLFAADEVFLTGSAKHILPITKIDTTKIGNGKPGEVTQKISELYFDYFNKY